MHVIDASKGSQATEAGLRRRCLRLAQRSVAFLHQVQETGTPGRQVTSNLARPTRSASLAARIRGPWRIAVAEASMVPSIAAGDWLLVDPTITRWPRRGTVVVFREPGGGELAVKRVAAGPGDRVPFADGILELAEDEAWLLSDATDAQAAAEGFGEPIDSRRYGPVPLDLLVARAWFRYAPRRKMGLIPGRAGRASSPDRA